MKKFIVGALVLISFALGWFVFDRFLILTPIETSAKLNNFFDRKTDLGNIPMSQGIARLSFNYKNTTGKPMNLTQLFTTCMCTKAKLIVNGQSSSFAGMQGHQGGLAPINPNMMLNPGEAMTVEVEFDPNAHGPEGVGPITRSVILETDSTVEPKVEFVFTGTVTR